MRKMIIASIAMGMAQLISCQSTGKESDPAEKNKWALDTITAPNIKPNYSGLQFASLKDTTCSMPLSAGIGDTLVLEGRIYGFCAKECKDDFAKQLVAQHKR